jgi:hypothetical protein
LGGLEEFNNLQNNGLYSIAKIEWWLLKYWDYYKELKDDWVCKGNECCMYAVGHCTCIPKSEEQVFIDLYEKLDELSRYHRREDYAKKELESYNLIRSDQIKLKEWVRRNELIGADECFEFLINYLDYCTNPIHLKVWDKSLVGYDIFVDRSDFKNLIEFMEIFSDLFWVKEIYPESEILVSIKKKMKECRPEILDDTIDSE